MQSLIFEQTLKIVVYLTSCKPYVDRESKMMNIKHYLQLDFNTMVQLKEYLLSQLSLEKCRDIDFKR